MQSRAKQQYPEISGKPLLTTCQRRKGFQAVTDMYYTSAVITKIHGLHSCLLRDQKINPTIGLTWEMNKQG